MTQGICDSCGETPPSLRWKYPELQKKKKKEEDGDKNCGDAGLERAETSKKQPLPRRRSQPELVTGQHAGAGHKAGKRLEKRNTQMSFDYQVTRRQSFCGMSKHLIMIRL